MIHSLTVSLRENLDLGHSHYLAVFEAPAIASVTLPAQFVMLRVRQGNDPLLGRPFSVARVGRRPGGATVDILYKATGYGTTILAALRPGDQVGMVGPLGRPFPDPPPASRHVFMVAGGIGIAPFPILGEYLHSRNIASRLLYGARTAADLVGRDLFAASGVTVGVATDDGSEGHPGFVSELLEQELAALPAAERSNSVSYVCGPTPMMAATEAVIARQGSTGHFSLESFMGCGFGVCLSCVVPVKGPAGEEEGYCRICVDGPSFAAGRIDWQRSHMP